jgi:hypothetical protein
MTIFLGVIARHPDTAVSLERIKLADNAGIIMLLSLVLVKRFGICNNKINGLSKGQGN